MECNTTNLEYTLQTCSQSINLKAALTPGEIYTWKIENKFGRIRIGTAIADIEGSILIELIEFPDGTFNQHAGSFNLTLKDSFGDNVSFMHNGIAYDKIIMTFTENTGEEVEMSTIDLAI